MGELYQAHLDYERRRFEVVQDLNILLENTANESVKEILKNAIEFVKEKEV